MRVTHPCAGRPQIEIDAFDALATGHDPCWPPDPEHLAALVALHRDGLILAFDIPDDAPVYAIPNAIYDQWCEAVGVVPPFSGEPLC